MREPSRVNPFLFDIMVKHLNATMNLPAVYRNMAVTPVMAFQTYFHGCDIHLNPSVIGFAAKLKDHIRFTYPFEPHVTQILIKE